MCACILAKSFGIAKDFLHHRANFEYPYDGDHSDPGMRLIFVNISGTLMGPLVTINENNSISKSTH